MKSPWTKTLLLLGLGVGLGVYIYYFEIKKAEKDEKAKEASEKILQFDKDQVRRFTVSNIKGTVELEKSAQGQWRVIKPVEDQASDLDVTSFLTAVESQKYEDVVGEKKSLDLKAFGLNPGTSTLEIYFNNGNTQKIILGTDASLAGKLYLMVDSDSRVLYAGTAIKFQLDKSAKDFREKKILRFSKDDVKKITLNSKGQPTIEKKEDGWHLISPVQERADQEMAASFLGQLESVNATEFLSEKGDLQSEKKKYKLDKPELALKLYGAEGKELGTLFASKKTGSGSYVMWAGQKAIYEVFNNLVEQFTKAADEIRDRKLMFRFSKSDVKEIKMKTSLVDLHILNKDGRWALALPDEKRDVVAAQVDALLQKLSELKIVEFQDIKAQAAQVKKGSIELKNEKGEVIIAYKWGEKTASGKATLMTVDRSPKAMGVDTNIIDVLPGQTLISEKSVPAASPGGQ